MKNRRYAIFALALLGLALIANQSLAQSIYEPYRFITLAGDSGFGSTDGMGSGAQFWNPSGVAVDSVGNVYVADQGNNTIRKVTPGGEVATLAGLAGSSGSADGTGSVARFNQPFGVAVDNAGILYVADTGNHTIRKGYAALAITSFGSNFGFSGGFFGFNLSGPAGTLVVIETSTDLVSWLPIWTNTLADAPHFSDLRSGRQPGRFYRAQSP